MGESKHLHLLKESSFMDYFVLSLWREFYFSARICLFK